MIEILGEMANGRTVTVVPHDAELTTQQAADLLHVSRPHLVAILGEGAIPFRLVGTHRRLRVADVLAFKQADDRRRARVLDRLTAQAERLGLGY